jgi:hypothetical protein
METGKGREPYLENAEGDHKAIGPFPDRLLCLGVVEIGMVVSRLVHELPPFSSFTRRYSESTHTLATNRE